MRALTVDEIETVSGGYEEHWFQSGQNGDYDTVGITGFRGTSYGSAGAFFTLGGGGGGGHGYQDQNLVNYALYYQSLQAEADEPSPADIAANLGIQVKSGPNAANIADLPPVITSQFQLIRDVYRCVIGDPVPWITSGNDGGHMKGSLHYENLAIDLRANDLSAAQVSAIVALLKLSLPGGFFVQYEQFENPFKNHIHIEYDP